MPSLATVPRDRHRVSYYACFSRAGAPATSNARVILARASGMDTNSAFGPFDRELVDAREARTHEYIATRTALTPPLEAHSHIHNLFVTTLGPHALED